MTSEHPPAFLIAANSSAVAAECKLLAVPAVSKNNELRDGQSPSGSLSIFLTFPEAGNPTKSCGQAVWKIFRQFYSTVCLSTTEYMQRQAAFKFLFLFFVKIGRFFSFLKSEIGVPIVAHWKQIWLVSMRVRNQSLALLSGLKIRHCCELYRRSQMWLGSCVAVAVVWASSCTSDSTPSLGTSICHGYSP